MAPGFGLRGLFPKQSPKQKALQTRYSMTHTREKIERGVRPQINRNEAFSDVKWPQIRTLIIDRKYLHWLEILRIYTIYTVNNFGVDTQHVLRKLERSPSPTIFLLFFWFCCLLTLEIYFRWKFNFFFFENLEKQKFKKEVAVREATGWALLCGNTTWLMKQ